MATCSLFPLFSIQNGEIQNGFFDKTYLVFLWRKFTLEENPYGIPKQKHIDTASDQKKSLNFWLPGIKTVSHCYIFFLGISSWPLLKGKTGINISFDPVEQFFSAISIDPFYPT